MLIEFDKMEEQVIPEFLGGEGVFHTRMRVDELGKIMRGALEPGSCIGPAHPRYQQRDHLYSGREREGTL